MGNIYLFSGPCGCGKTTLATAYANYLVEEKGKKQVYLIHGDNFQTGFIASNVKYQIHIEESKETDLKWPDILRFTWECIIDVAQKALKTGLDVVIDYIVEDELPLVQQLAKENNAKLYYVVLTACDNTIHQRIVGRGDSPLKSRASFLKQKLDNQPENQCHLFDNTGLSVSEELHCLEIEKFILEP